VTLAVIAVLLVGFFWLAIRVRHSNQAETVKKQAQLMFRNRVTHERTANVDSCKKVSYDSASSVMPANELDLVRRISTLYSCQVETATCTRRFLFSLSKTYRGQVGTTVPDAAVEDPCSVPSNGS
jgi:hypothetical protein